MSDVTYRKLLTTYVLRVIRIRFMCSDRGSISFNYSAKGEKEREIEKSTEEVALRYVNRNCYSRVYRTVIKPLYLTTFTDLG